MFQAGLLSYTPEYLVRTPFPLAPLNSNACPHFSIQMASSRQTSCDTPKKSYRQAAKNSLPLRKPHEERDRRQQVFLNKVRQVSADKKWESRSEQILRNDFLLRKREWELDQARSAPEGPQVLDDDERETDSTSMEKVEKVEQILSQENQEFEGFVSSMQDIADLEHQQQKENSDYGSDDEEYDHLFMEVISRQGSAERSTSAVGDDAPKQDQEMDVSVG